MAGIRYSQEFRDEAVRQVTERGHSVADVAERLGVTAHTLYRWVRAARPPKTEREAADLRKANDEIKRLEKELRRTREERDILKKPRRTLRKGPRLRYAFIRDHRGEFRVRTMCRVLGVARSGFYAWLREPLSARARDDQRLVARIRTFHAESDSSYGSPRIFKDLREAGESCSLNRVARLMRRHKIRGHHRYKKPRFVAGRPSTVAPNRLERKFEQDQPNRAWVTDITYVRTLEGWLYLAVVIDLFSRRVVGWSMQRRIDRHLVLQALLMAVRRRRPTSKVLIHSDQGSQFGSDDWHRFCRDHGLVPSMSRRGNCWDNAVVESFFGSLKKERIRGGTYRTRDVARADLFDYIEVTYNRRRRHSHLGDVSPEAFEEASKLALEVST
ncbi:MAG: IS3 family transposase [bacterium]